MMNCKQAREFIPLLAAEGLEEAAARQVSEHAQTCPECAASLARSRKLHGLLALKRYEQPDELFLRNLVSEFHRRLDAEPARRTSLWERVCAILDLEGRAAIALRASVALAAVVIVVVGLQVSHFIPNRPANRQVAAHQSGGQPWSDLVVTPDRNTVYVLDRVAYNSATHESAILAF
jgi:anti-sigma factor RsiW